MPSSKRGAFRSSAQWIMEQPTASTYATPQAIDWSFTAMWEARGLRAHALEARAAAMISPRLIWRVDDDFHDCTLQAHVTPAPPGGLLRIDGCCVMFGRHGTRIALLSRSL